MPRLLPVTSYQVYVAATSTGFNEWRQDIVIRTTDTTTSADVRFVDDPSTTQQWQTVRETGWSQVYLPTREFSRFLEVLRTEKPLSLVLYQQSQRVIVQTGPEPPGEEEGA